MKRIKIDYGIDLGTTNSAVARINNGQIEVKEIDRATIVPSCVAYTKKGTVRVGITALNIKDEPHFLEFKRKMGTDWREKKHPLIEEYIGAEDLSSEVLKKLRAEITDEVFKSIVITVPAMFDMNQVAATKRAGELAGFEQVEILMEPIAAAFAYGFKHRIQDAQYIVFDFGGGTFDAALVKSEGGVLSVLSSEGDNHLGGKDLDNAVVEEVLLPLLKKDYNIDGLSISELDELKKRLKRTADQLKIDLGKSEKSEVLSGRNEYGSDADGKEIEIDHVFQRSDIYKVMTPIFQKAIDLTKKLIKANQLSLSEVKALVLVGGPTQIPAFRELIEKELMKPDTSLNPMTAIAEGAALYSATMNNHVQDHGKPLNATEDEGADKTPLIDLEIEYSATSVSDQEPIGIKRKNKNQKIYAIVNRSSEWQSSKHELDDVIMVQIDQARPNTFTIQLFDEHNNLIKSSPSEFTIIPGTSVDGGAPIPYHIGMEIYNDKKGMVFTPFKGLEKDKKLPLTGVTDRDLFTTSDIRPGVESDKMIIPVYLAEREANNSRSIINLYSNTIEINGMDVEKLVPENSLVEFTMRIDISQNMTLEVDFPQLDIETIEKKLNFPRKASVTKKQINDLFAEIEKSTKRLEESAEPVAQLSDFLAKKSYYKSQYRTIVDEDFEQLFNELRSFLLELDLAEDLIRWPTLKKEIIDSLYKFENLATESIQNKINGWEKDQSDLEYFKKQKDLLFSMINVDMTLAEELKEMISSANLELVIRTQGKELFIHMIKDIDNRFNEIDWKNKSSARDEVNKGISLIKSGANQTELRMQAVQIVEQMKKNDVNIEGSVKG